MCVMIVITICNTACSLHVWPACWCDVWRVTCDVWCVTCDVSSQITCAQRGKTRRMTDIIRCGIVWFVMCYVLCVMWWVMCDVMCGLPCGLCMRITTMITILLVFNQRNTRIFCCSLWNGQPTIRWPFCRFVIIIFSVFLEWNCVCCCFVAAVAIDRVCRRASWNDVRERDWMRRLCRCIRGPRARPAAPCRLYVFVWSQVMAGNLWSLGFCAVDLFSVQITLRWMKKNN